MNATQVTWIVIIVVVILAILGFAFYFSRRRSLASHRTQAAELRQAAQDDELTAREVDAKAARAVADAKQSEVDAARSRLEAVERQREADAVRSRADDQARQADDVDPDIDVRSRRALGPDDVPAAAEQPPTSAPPAAAGMSSDESEAERFDETSGTGLAPHVPS
ncbi:MAG: hypothetical protein ABI238_06440 [Terrimesophilobacter sp.]